MRLSIFTAASDATYLDESYAALLRQSHGDWEWHVVLHGAAAKWAAAHDPRVSAHRIDGAAPAARAKREACAAAAGEVLVELDAGDVLVPHALREIRRAFEDDPRNPVAVYSDSARMNADGTANRDRPREELGWTFENVLVERRWFLRARAMEPLPHNVAHAGCAPRHVRAWAREAYEHVGGHDEASGPLEDLDLVDRLYRAGETVHVPQCLYLERLTGGADVPGTGDDSALAALYREHAVDMTKAWSRRRGLGGGTLFAPGYTASIADPSMQVAVLDMVAPEIDAPNDSLGILLALGLMPRVENYPAFFAETLRALAHGGLLLIDAPSGVNGWTERELEATTGFQIGHVAEQRALGPGELEERRAAYLYAVKEGPRIGGALKG